MRIVFMGTPRLAATVLEGLARAHDVVGVFTRPDAVRGRGKKLAPSPVKQSAIDLGLDVHTASTLGDAAIRAHIADLKPDAICVAAFGIILPKDVLDIPPLGCLNVHTSLLPRWRGAAPIERAIIERDDVSGVCIMRMDEGLDTGPVCKRIMVPVGDKYVGELASELAGLGAAALLESLEAIVAGEVEWTEQAVEGVTYATKIEKRELDWDLDATAHELASRVRASSASHPSRLAIANRRVAAERACVCADEALLAEIGGLEPGEAALVRRRLFAGARQGIVELEQVRPEGKKSMTGLAFASGIQGIKNTRTTWGRA